ncbi:ribosome biogenesis GTPase [Colletotrichum tofieldiae]|nr:ribosome biogenesis GTPase [Colletotrichum tofieldiae]GKT84890.1 ribosome biogenesis GTPase [Colletotrichum tofieldiae]
MLTLTQRKMWAKYLKENGIAYRFFSASLAKEMLEALELEDSESDEQETGSSSQPASKTAADEESNDDADEESSEEEEDQEEGGAGTSQQEVEVEVDDEDTRILTVEELEGIFLSHAPENAGGTGIPTAQELLSAYAKARGFTTQGLGQPDESRASRYILKDYVNGKLLYCEPPPGTMDGPEFNHELYDASHLPEKRRQAVNASLDTMSFMGDDISIAPSDLAVLPAGPKSKKIDKGFFGADGTGTGHLKMPFAHKYSEQGQKHLSGRKARAMIALENGVDPKDVKLSSGKKHFKGGAKSRKSKKPANEDDD